MGSGKAFGNALQSYNLEEKEIYKVLDETKACPVGSFVLACYLSENGKSTFEANDLDFFIKNTKKEHITKLQSFVQYKGYTKMSHLTNPTYKNNKNIVDVFEYQNIENKKKIQIIVINCNIEEHIKNFDLDCCQTFWDNINKKIVCYGENVLEKKTILNPHQIKYNTFRRAIKYIERGFKIYYDGKEITELCKFIHFYSSQIHPEETKNFFLKANKKKEEDSKIKIKRIKGGIPTISKEYFV